jgi:hypothetical protein
MPKAHDKPAPKTPYSRPSRSGNAFADNHIPNRGQANDGAERPPWYHSPGSTDDYVREAIEWLLKNHAPHTVQTIGAHTQFRCCYCRQFFPPSALQIEHIVPFSTIALTESFTQSEYRLVTNDVANLTYACGNVTGNGCNQSKRDKQPIPFLNSLTTTDQNQFLQDAPWARWMFGGVVSMYNPPWNNPARPNLLASAYVAAVDMDLIQRTLDTTPRPPLPLEPCLIDRNNRVIASVACVNYLRNNNRLPAWMTDQVIKNIVQSDQASPYQKQYTPEQYAGHIAATASIPSPLIEAILWQVTNWPRR